MERIYQIEGKRVTRELFFDWLTRGDWRVANLSKPNIPKVTKQWIEDTTPISPERAREIRNLNKYQHEITNATSISSTST